jgi:transketolase C-terminal domain/subunit
VPNKLKKYKIEDCKPGMIGHWIWLMIGALKNMKDFKKQKIGLGNLSSIKPINLNDIKKIKSKTKKIITFEDHNIYDGLGSADNEEVIKVSSKTQMFDFGINDVFTQSGSVKELYKNYQLDEISIKKKIISTLF